MLPLRKKLLYKFVILELFALTLGLGVTYLTKAALWVAPALVIGISLLGFIEFVTYPLEVILREMKALLTGKRYNRIYTEKVDEVGILAHFFNEVTHSLERVSTDIKEHRRISSELNIAQKIQRDLLPKTAPKIAGLNIIAKTKPAAEIGGDSFDFITKNDQTFMYIGDVTGHGVPSGLVMMIVYTLIHTFSDMVENSQQLLIQVNKYLKPRIQRTMFMTMVMFRWNHRSQEMFYTGAGHETILHYKALEGKVENLKCGGIALGMVPDIEKLTKEVPLPLQQGDFLVLYSDGIVESKNAQGEMFGVPGLQKVVEKYAGKAPNAETLLTQIATTLTHFLGDFFQEDDMSLLVIHRSDTSVEPGKVGATTEWNTDIETSGRSLIDYDGKEAMKESGLESKVAPNPPTGA